MSVNWYGGDFLNTLQNNLDDALLEGAQEFLDAAKAKAPRRRRARLVESGYVGNSKSSTYKKKPGYYRERKAERGQAVAGFAVFYAWYQEAGTVQHAAQPYMRPALDEKGKDIGFKIVIFLSSKLNK